MHKGLLNLLNLAGVHVQGSYTVSQSLDKFEYLLPHFSDLMGNKLFECGMMLEFPCFHISVLELHKNIDDDDDDYYYYNCNNPYIIVMAEIMLLLCSSIKSSSSFIFWEIH